MADDFLMVNANLNSSKLDQSSIDSFPLGMCYVPLQKFRDLYSADVGLNRGTIFSELDKPFLGRRAIDD